MTKNRRRLSAIREAEKLDRFNTMSTSELHALRIDYGAIANVRAHEQSKIHARIRTITEILRRRERGLEVSDHAVVRYLERYCGLDTDAIRAEIAAKVEAAENNKVDVTGEAVGHLIDGYVFVVARNSLVVTIHPKKEDDPDA